MKHMKKNYNTVLSLLEKCQTMIELKQLHGQMIKTSVMRYIIPLSKLIDFCSNPKTGNLNHAKSVFDSIDHPSVYIWNSMIKGFSSSNNPAQALVFHREMLQKGYLPDHFTFPFVLKACSALMHLYFGKSVHSCISKTGFEANVYVSTCLLHMYATCGDMEIGLKVFDEIPKWNFVAWSVLIAGYVNNNQFGEAIRVFKDMKRYDAVPNEITLVNVLAACSRSKDIRLGKQVHSMICKMSLDAFSGSSFDFNVILATAVRDMYAKCGELETARYMFDEMPSRNLVSWNSIIHACCQHGDHHEALQLFLEMQVAGFEPDRATLLSVIGACNYLSSLRLGEIIHAYVSKLGQVEDTAIVNALVDMYAKMGDVENAEKIFYYLENKDTMAWTSMIIGLASNGHKKEALRCFRRLQEDSNIVPDEITYIGVLWACSHGGLVEEGQRHFVEMKSVYGIEPMVEHYGCMVDLLSRAGRFEEAERLVHAMPFQPNLPIWVSILNGCNIHGNIDMADEVRRQIMGLEKLGSGSYVLLSNIYAKAGKWHEASLARELMKRGGVGKVLGHSSYGG